MHKGARQLDQALVKIPVGPPFVGQPQILEDIMRLIKQLAIETVKISEIMRIQVPALKRLDHAGDAGAFVTHAAKIAFPAGNTNNLKPGQPGCRLGQRTNL